MPLQRSRNERRARTHSPCNNEQIRHNSIESEFDGGKAQLVQVDVPFVQHQNTCLKGEIATLKARVEDLEKDNTRWEIDAEKEYQSAVKLDKQYRKQKDKTSKLEKQVAAFKREISSSTRLEQQLSDQVIDIAFRDLFCRIRDWAHRTIYQKVPDIRVGSQEATSWLADYVPHHDEKNRIDKVHAFLAIVAGVLVEAFSPAHVFGSAEDGPVLSANDLYKAFYAGNQGQEKQTKQWLLLKRQLVSRMDGGPLEKANAAATQEILHLIQQRLEALSSLEFTAGVQKSLATAIAPGLELLQSLRNQLEDYSLELLPAHEAGQSRAFNPQNMEDEAAEETGSVKASIFPILYKMVDGENGIKERVVICKARVVLFQL